MCKPGIKQASKQAVAYCWHSPVWLSQSQSQSYFTTDDQSVSEFLVTKLCKTATMDTHFVLMFAFVNITVDTSLPREHVYRAVAW
jgi:hypothetical protein